MGNYSKDTEFYHITGPGLLSGKNAVPSLSYYNKGWLNSGSATKYNGDIANSASYPGNFIFTIAMDVDGEPDEVIAAVYNRSVKGEAPNPDILFHRTSRAWRVGPAVSIGAAEVGAEIITLGSWSKAKNLVKAGKNATLGLTKKLLSMSARRASRSAAAKRVAIKNMKNFWKTAGSAVKTTSEVEQALVDVAGSYAKAWSAKRKATYFKAASLVEAGAAGGVIAGASTGSVLLLSLIPGYTGYETYLWLLENYVKFLNPYEIRSWYIDGLDPKNSPSDTNIPPQLYALKSVVNAFETPSFNKHEMPWYTIEISPTKNSKNYLNSEGGLVNVKKGMIDLDKLKDSASALNRISNDAKELALDIGDVFVPGSIGDREESLSGVQSSAIKYDLFYLDFWKPIDFVTIVAMIQMLDVQNPLYNKFTKHRADIETLVTKQVLNPILEALKNTVQYRTLKALNAYLDKTPLTPEMIGDIRAGKQIKTKSIYQEIEADAIYTDYILEKLEISSADEDSAVFATANLIADNLAKEYDLEELEDFRARLKKDIEKVFVPESVQANLSAEKGTNFGVFCLNYINIFKTLSEGWVTGPKKKSSAVKAKKAAQRKALTTATPNLAKLADQREAELAEQRIIKVPFKKTAQFEAHSDFITPLSVLDEMRTEKSGHLFDNSKDIENIASAAPIPTTDDFINSLASLKAEQRKSLKESLLKRKKLNTEKSATLMQDLKRMQFSPRFLMAQALSGASGLFPIRTTNGVIDLPDINIESVTSIINNSINTQINAVQSQVLNASSAIAASATDIVSSAGSVANRVGLELPFDASFIKIKNNTYSEKVSAQMNDIKKILNKPTETTQKVKTIKQESINTLRQYQDLCEELQKLQIENVKIDAYVVAIDQSENVDGKKDNYKNLIDNTQKKIDAVIVKKQTIENKVNDSVNKGAQTVDGASQQLVATVNEAAVSKPKIILTTQQGG